MVFGLMNMMDVPSASGDPHFANVALLLNFDGPDQSTNFTDLSNVGHTISRNGDTKIVTAESKFGGSSAYFDGSGDYLGVANSNDLIIGTNDFTIEAWVKHASSDAGGVFQLENSVLPSNEGGVALGYAAPNGAAWRRFLVGNGTNFGAPSLNVWHHLAFTREGGTVRIFVDGVLERTDSNTSNLSTQDSLTIGGWYSTTWLARVWIDSFRFTNGVARYTSTFVPPTEQFPTQ